MIKNDYIRTSTDRTTQAIKDTDTASEKQQKSIQYSKQLDEVVSGKHKLKKLSNPL